MPDLTRLWLFPRSDEARAVEFSARTPGAPLTASYRLDFDGSHCTSARVDSAQHLVDAAGESSPPPVQHEELGRKLFATLDELARRHAGEQLALSIDAVMLGPLVRRALGVAAEAVETDVENLVIDWPAREAEHLRCAFIGLDLDWCPPPPVAVVARFPGGPGSAATTRR